MASLKYRPFWAALLSVATVLAQVPVTPRPSALESGDVVVPQAEDTVLRISVTLVQVDAVVTDAKGKQITDLKAGDFELFQDGKPQKITHFSYVNAVAATPPTPAAPPVAPRNKNLPPPPPPKLRAGDVRRTIALVVDDLGLSFESMAYVRQSLRKFVDEQMQPNDLVAIVRTGSGAGAFQQFTSDKRLLYASIDRLKWNFLGRGGISAFAPINETSGGEGGIAGGAGGSLDEFRHEYFTVGTLGAISYIVQGLRELPGRKSIILLSDNLKIFNADGTSDRVLDNLRNLTDQANRSSVVIYTVDARGLPALSLTAADKVDVRNPQHLAQTMMNRRTEYFQSQDGLNYLAEETGGLFMHDTNDIAGSIRKVMADTTGYYLIGYQPDESTFRTNAKGERTYHRIKVQVKRTGLHVRSRNGFFGTPESDRPQRPVYHGRDEQLLGALASPFSQNAIPLRLTSLFAENPKIGPYLYSMVHIGARDMTFTDEPDGWHKAVMDVLLITYGDKGEEVDRKNQTYTIRMRGDTYKRALEAGLVYSMNYPVKKAGAFQLRAAVRDSASEKVGTASQFIEVPDLKKGRLTLSGIVIRGAPLKPPAPPAAAPGTPAPPSEQAPPPPSQQAGAKPAVPAEGAVDDDPLASPALRIFQPGRAVVYAYQVMNAHTDAARKPQLETQLKLFRDGQPVYTGKLNEYTETQQAESKDLLIGGRLQLGTKMEPGDYVMQVVAVDKLGKEKTSTASQSIDFEVQKK